MKIMSNVNVSHVYRFGQALSRSTKERADSAGAEESRTGAAAGKETGEAEMVKNIGKPSEETETAQKTAGTEEAKDSAEETAAARLRALTEQNERTGFGFSAGSDANGAKSGTVRTSSGSTGDSVGQLASQLANAETDMAVREIQGKVMRSLTNLKMAEGLSEGEDKEKIAAQIRRMEKLQKKVLKKLKQLSQEADLERERERAVKKQEEAKAKEAERELKTGRKKRRREEQEYARRENIEDSQSSDPFSALSGSGAGSGSVGSSAAIPSGAAVSGASFDVSMPTEGAFVDVSV